LSKHLRGLVAIVLALLPLLIAAQQNDDPATPTRDPGLRIAGLLVKPSIGLSVGHDSNINLAPDGAEADSTFARLSPALRLEAGDARSLIVGTYTGEFARYTSSRLDDYRDHRFGLSWFYNPLLRHALALEASTASLHDQRGTAAREGSLGLLPLAVDRYRHDQLGGRYRFGAPGARGRVEVEAGLGRIDYRNNRDLTVFRDRRDRSLAGAFQWRVAPRTSALARVEWDRYDYRVATLDSRERRLLLGVEFDATARTTGTLLVGRGNKRFEDDSRLDYSGAAWRASLEWRPRSYSIVTVSTGREADETNGTGDFILRRDLAAGWSHAWTPRIRTTLDAGIARERYDPSPRSDRARYVGAGVEYAARRWLRFGASWRELRRDSAVDEFEYDRRLMLLTAEVTL
jgi:hypothetical protein